MNFINSFKKFGFVKSFHLHRSSQDDWIDAIYWLGSTFFAGLMPVWLPMLFFTLFSRTPSLSDFTQNGEFALISASLISASLYIVTKESKLNILRGLLGGNEIYKHAGLSFPNQRLFIYLTLFLTFVSSIIFMGALFAKIPEVNLILDEDLVHWLSLMIFGITLFLSFFITVIDNAFTNRPDILGLRKESLEDLDKKFDALEEDN